MDERLCTFTQTVEIVVLDTAVSGAFQIRSKGRLGFGRLLVFMPVMLHGACGIMRFSVVPVKLMLLIGTRHSEGVRSSV